MRKDVYISEVLSKCQAMKTCGLWPREQKVRPAAWLDNFEESDKEIAAILLDNFIYYNAEHTDALLAAAYNSISSLSVFDQTNKLNTFIDNTVFTIVTGERPNITDSGYQFIRKLRRQFRIPEDKIVTLEEAFKLAKRGHNVIFVDDFVGSGEQFSRVWTKELDEHKNSFSSLSSSNTFYCIYITLITTALGLEKISSLSSNISVVYAHVLNSTSTIYGLAQQRKVTQTGLDYFLAKYSSKISPDEDYITANPDFLMKGYRSIGAMIGFEHGVPDATLPIFWSEGVDDSWTPLILRS